MSHEAARIVTTLAIFGSSAGQIVEAFAWLLTTLMKHVMFVGHVRFTDAGIFKSLDYFVDLRLVLRVGELDGMCGKRRVPTI